MLTCDEILFFVTNWFLFYDEYDIVIEKIFNLWRSLFCHDLPLQLAFVTEPLTAFPVGDADTLS
jgi:hypothetical protein